ncbi:nicotinate-nucleotide adenylyltransferase [uncultured Shimia sp.]|uniref:nicotinate-nucleotide adenylyltransferase n=1 Tax=uncultured Shimia sp. TaxID=573152 RepID=UPI002622C693|nr:nicotinate-nucleotide adenylyltransferase [uncultured Shimia sp.]
MPYGLPYVARGQRIGLLGGSFDPPHKGHVHITLEALKRFGLDQVWWLVSPGNPLKDRGPAKLARRMSAAREIMDHPRVQITDFEAHVGTRFTAETIAVLQDKCPQAQFVWLMGADNLAQFHLWRDWQDIMARVPIGVLARPGDRIEARTAKAAQVYRRARLHPRSSWQLSRAKAPVWAFANVPMRDISSTELRKNGAWAES